ncbi:hypothetical protein GGD62_003510 [Bradyrhizobium sp. ERR14]|nr:hypothetical protein [Bradyrhizobium sp. ERR14]
MLAPNISWQIPSSDDGYHFIVIYDAVFGFEAVSPITSE